MNANSLSTLAATSDGVRKIPMTDDQADHDHNRVEARKRIGLNGIDASDLWLVH